MIINTDRVKEEKERQWLEIFQKNYSGCPQSKPTKQETPDFIFRENCLGIEVTEYLLGQGTQGSKYKQFDVFHNRVVKSAKEIFESITTLSVNVRVSWGNGPLLKTEEAQKLSSALAQFILDTVSSGQQMGVISEWEFDNSILEKYLSAISFDTGFAPGSNSWSVNNSYFPGDAAVRIQERLNSKERKVLKCRESCSNLWLLIATDKYCDFSGFWPDEKLFNIQYRSSFDRCFLLDEANTKVYVLNLKH